MRQQHKGRFEPIRLWWTGLLCLVILTGCSALEEARWQEPEVSVTGTELVRLTPTGADLEARFNVSNPNAFAITLGALDYDLAVNGSRLFSGEQTQGDRLEAGAEQEVRLPVTLEFSELVDFVSNFAQRDALAYEIATGMSFEIPVVGRVRVPATASGEVPIPRLPTLEVFNLRTERIGIGGADMILSLRLQNPNVFDLVIDRFSYEFALDNYRVAGGESRQRVTLEENSDGMVEIPLNVSFVEAGTSVYRAIMNGEPLMYGLSFETDVRSSLPQMDDFPFSAVREGQVDLR